MAAQTKQRSSLADLSDRYLECRDLRHAWRQVRYEVVTRNTRGNPLTVRRTARCTRCTTEREDDYRFPSWARLRSRYYYPHGYVLTELERPITAADVRREAFERNTWFD